MAGVFTPAHRTDGLAAFVRQGREHERAGRPRDALIAYSAVAAERPTMDGMESCWPKPFGEPQESIVAATNGPTP